ncbi:hypothetical protein DXG01_000105 [Tephrocybe rancida]|nr:hypothetical protein DXG01_000105 [Tephrocybe rancida]
MGFCRRCGEIVAGVRCKCGGTAVAPVIPWNQTNQIENTHDKWSKTYVQRPRSVSPTRPITPPATGSTTVTQASPTKRFPRPLSHAPSSSKLENQVSAHIASSTPDTRRPSSPLKYGTRVSAPEADILPSLNDTTLSKVYGSVLQPKESLTTHSCALCCSPFPPDATIYPDPASSDSSRFLCRPCYTANGGTKGVCPTCSRPVLTLKSEGQFIHAADQYWHKRCFNCSGCFKYIGETPMVDFLGRPSCADCFEGSLKRDPATPKKYISTSAKNSPRIEKSQNIGGMSSASKTGSRKSREGSPAIEELEHRLGIKREGSPALEDLSQRLAAMKMPNYVDGSPTGRKLAISHQENRHLSQSSESPRSHMDYSPNRTAHMRSPPAIGKPTALQRQSTGSPAATAVAIEEMKQRFTKSPSPSRGTSSPISPAIQNTPPLGLSRSFNSMRSSPIAAPRFDPSPASSPLSPIMPPTPDLMSDFSDTTTQSSFGPDSPLGNDETNDVFNALKAYGTGYGSRYTRRDFFDESEDAIVEETASQMGTPTRTPNSVRSRATPPSKSSWSTPSFISPSQSKSLKSSPFPSSNAPSGSSPTPTSSSCEGCGKNLFSIRGGGKFVTVPGDGAVPSSMTYHVECFRCAVCDGVFSDANAGQAVFVKANGGACHVEFVIRLSQCAPPAKVTIHKVPTIASSPVATASPPVRPAMKTPHSTPASSSRLERLPSTAPPTTVNTSFPRFGSRTTCPGCANSVSPMEQGVVPGPQNTRWHASCLVCGGKKETPKGMVIWRSREEKKIEPGCGKKLDSAAKTGVDGGLLLGVGGSPQPSPTRAPLSPTFTGPSRLTPQITGTTTIARQFTGIGGDPGLLRQLTGGGLSPTRSISPTKQLGSGMRPRPKSVIGMRSAKSVDEGRGMFLVRQFTGTG